MIEGFSVVRKNCQVRIEYDQPQQDQMYSRKILIQYCLTKTISKKSIDILLVHVGEIVDRSHRE